MAKESAENVQKLKACIDAKDDACAQKVGSTIELNEKAYTELRVQDQMAGRAYESLAQHYADILAHCEGNCDWLRIALEKTLAEGATNFAYSILGVGSVPKPGNGVKSAEPVNSSVVKIERQTTSGLKLTADPNKTTTVLGAFKDDTGAIINELRLPKSTDFGSRKGGFNLLNTPDNLYKNPTQFWNEYNRPWLDNVISRNDSIILATKSVKNDLYRMNEGTKQMEMTGFGREYNYLIENGYTFDSAKMQMTKVK